MAESEQQQQQVTITENTLVIIYDPTNGQCQVSGPITDRVKAYGMLEAAREAIEDFNRQLNTAKVQPATFMPPIPPGRRPF